MSLDILKYNIQMDKEEKLKLVNTHNEQSLECELPITRIKSNEGKVLETLNQSITKTGNDLIIDCQLEKDIKVINTVRECSGFVEIHTEIKNEGEKDVSIDSVDFLNGIKISNNYNRAYVTDRSMVGYGGIFELNEKSAYTSYSVVGLTEISGTNSMILGFKRFDDAFYSFGLNNDGKYNYLDIKCDREDVALKPDSTIELAPLLIGIDNSLSNQLEKYGDIIGKEMGAKAAKQVKTGWCSWYYYYGTESEQDIIDNVIELSKSPLKDNIKVIQIDDGWNLPYNGHDRVWGDWHPGSKFPKGMKYIVDIIHEHGFEAGLWLAPFSVDINSKLAKEHPEWMVQGENEETLLNPATQFGIFGLDLTNDEALDFVRETFDRVFNEWGFDYIKIDFLEHGLMKGKRSDDTKTSVEAFRMGLKVINEVKKDKFLLACGSPLAQAIGLCDAMRIGYDVGSKWYVPMNLGAWPYGNCSIVSAAYPTIYRQWMHKKWWQNDPDCIIARDYYTEGECENFSVLGTEILPEEFGLGDEETGFWIRLVWFTGGMKILSDVWSKLNSQRQKMIEDIFFESFQQEIMLVDWYEDIHCALMKTKEGPLKIGLFNMSDDNKTISIKADKFNIKKWRFVEKFNGDTFTGEGEMIVFPQLPGRSARIFQLS